jgi:SecD/SecF fusion protein
MLTRAGKKFIFLGVLLVLAVVFSLPSVVKTLPGWWTTILPAEGMRLGLDLQGGMYLTLKVDLPRAIENQLDLSMADLRETLRRRHEEYGPAETVGPNRARMEFSSLPAAEQALRIVAEDFPFLDASAGSLSDNKAYLDVSLKPKEVANIQESSVSQSLEVIRNRIDQFGVTEPIIARQGSDEIVVQLPGIKDPERAIKLIGRTAQLEFKLVDTEANVDLRDDG